VQLAAAEALFEQGDLADLVYVVEQGEMELVRSLADGSEQVLARHGPGEYFGELGPMFGARRSARARALAPSRVVGLPLSEFRRRFRRQDTSDLALRARTPPSGGWRPHTEPLGALSCAWAGTTRGAGSA